MRRAALAQLLNRIHFFLIWPSRVGEVEYCPPPYHLGAEMGWVDSLDALAVRCPCQTYTFDLRLAADGLLAQERVGRLGGGDDRRFNDHDVELHQGVLHGAFGYV